MENLIESMPIRILELISTFFQSISTQESFFPLILLEKRPRFISQTHELLSDHRCDARENFGIQNPIGYLDNFEKLVIRKAFPSVRNVK